MKNWIKQRKSQVRILLCLISFLIINHLILPAHEKTNYFRQKTNRLQIEYETMVNYQAHITYHQHNLPTIKHDTDEILDRIQKWRTISSIQNELVSIQQGKAITVVKQQNEESRLSDEMRVIRISQTLEGKYDTIIEYLTDLNRESNPVIIDECEFQNLSPLETDPDIQTTLNFLVYLVPL